MRPIHWYFALASAALLMASGAQKAGAQTPPAPQNTSTPASYCKQSSLTGPAFLNLLNTIIKHGDLTDVAFLQKTLGTKFNLSYGMKPDESPDHQHLKYDSDHVLDSPIHVNLDVHLDVIEDKPSLFGNAIAAIRFVGRGYINDCMKLPADDLESRYGADGFRAIHNSWGPLVGELAGQKIPGKNNTKLMISWVFGSSGLIQGVDILQER
jgi:hypothetical protein